MDAISTTGQESRCLDSANRLCHFGRRDQTVLRKGIKGGNGDALRIHFEKTSQRLPGIAAPVSVRTQGDITFGHPRTDHVRQSFHKIRSGDYRARYAFQNLHAQVIPDLPQAFVNQFLSFLAVLSLTRFQYFYNGQGLHCAPLPQNSGIEIGLFNDFFPQPLHPFCIRLVECSSAGLGKTSVWHHFFAGPHGIPGVTVWRDGFSL